MPFSCLRGRIGAEYKLLVVVPSPVTHKPSPFHDMSFITPTLQHEYPWEMEYGGADLKVSRLLRPLTGVSQIATLT